MFIRPVKTKNHSTGKDYTAYQLVESYRSNTGPRQRVIMYLGALDLPRSQWRTLAAILEERLTGKRGLFEAEPSLQAMADAVFASHDVKESLRQAHQERIADAEIVSVDLHSLATALHRSLGPELIANAFYERLGFAEMLLACGLSEHHRDLAKAVILARLIKPGSDLSTWRWLRNNSSIPEFMSTNMEKVGKDAIYEITDRLWLYKDPLEKALRAKEDILFPSEEAIFLYDLTNTYFEGACKKNKIAKRGKSKEKRADCPLVTLALAVDALGFPLFSQIYEGNKSEPETLTDVIKRLEMDGKGLFSQVKPTMIMDRGIATDDNLKLLVRKGYPYLVIERKDGTKNYEDVCATAPDGFQLVSGETEGERVYVKTMESVEVDGGIEGSPEGTKTKVSRLLCFSEGKAAKEDGIDHLKELRLLDDLERLQKSVSKGTIKDPGKINQRIGRIRERYPSIASHYEINLNVNVNETTILLTWQRKSSMESRSNRHGCYVIQTTHLDLEPARIWKLYTTLTRVESAFRTLKSNLGFRPIRHHGEDRTSSHLFVSVLAYHLVASIERALRQKGDTRTWATLVEQLDSHKRSTVTLRGKGNLLHQIRLSSTPESAHEEIYRLLDIKDPLPRRRRDLNMQM